MRRDRFETVCRTVAERSQSLLLTALIAALVMGQPLPAQEGVGDALGQMAQRGYGELAVAARDLDGRLHGTRLRTEHSLTPITDVVEELSLRKSWTAAGNLRFLEHRAVDLYELFEGVPRALVVDGRWYRITLFADGRWPSPARKARPVLVIDPEIHSNPERADLILFYLDGEAGYGAMDQLLQEPLIVVSLEELVGGRPRGPASSYPAELSLGPGKDQPLLEPVIPKTHTKVPPICVSGRLACSGGATPYFYLEQIYIDEDHEPIGGPELELEVHRLDFLAPTNTIGGVTFCGGDHTCNHYGPPNRFIFDGNVHKDALGRNLVFKDVNQTDQWISLNTSIALFPIFGSFPRHAEYRTSGSTVGNFVSSANQGWSIFLVEDDLVKGDLHTDMLRNGSPREFRTDLFHWLSGASKPSRKSPHDSRGVDQISLWRLENEPSGAFLSTDPGISAPYLHDYSSLDDSDDAFDGVNETILGAGVSELLFNTAVCNLGKSANTLFELDMTVFKVRGRFGCPVEHSCPDNVCTPGAETCSTCPQDCGPCPSSCVGQCGGFTGSCWCDEFCASAGDCCPDACSVCGACGGGGSCPFPPCDE